MRLFLAGLLTGVVLAASTGAFAGGRSAQVTPATAGERQIVKKLNETNRLLRLIFVDIPDLKRLESNTEHTCAYLRALVYRTAPAPTCF